MRAITSPVNFMRHVARTATCLFPAALLAFAICVAVVSWGSSRVPGGYDGSEGLNVTFGLTATIWVLGFLTRCARPDSKLAAATEAVALFIALCLIGSLATAALAIGSGPYIDSALAAIDRGILPFLDWRDLALSLPDYPTLQGLLARFYVSLNWQAFLFLAVALVFGLQRDMEALLTALSVGLLICILPFHWLPALGPYPYYGLGPEDVSGLVALPWDSPGKMEGLRNGTVETINVEVVSGLVAIPSFHACSAVIFAWAFWRYRLLRWPMLGVNSLMFVAAVPIGGHYFIDVIAGGAVGAVAIMAARALERLRAGDGRRSFRVSSPRPAVV